MKIIELFAGIGVPRRALEFAYIPHKTIWFSEIDKFAEKSYRAIFNDYETPNLWDILKININNLKKENIDVIIGGWSCQDISQAVFGKDMDKDSGTRSSLLWETLKIIEFYKPKWIINENFANVLNKKHWENIQKYCEYLYNLGYENDVKILNAKDYGIPQKRNRIFIINTYYVNSSRILQLLLIW
ncbi:MAG: DNA (cytosine-5-)-methyltransferase [Spiroplasma phoeniceum]|nr:MAG: DNA (cytosine-5-)-methyltransferase [Spiroplasma phoeniceum]UZQ33432.1 MAG: DNA (cytosine-5-)-methyltransferase [Spiroplasma phoeniceum]